MSNFPSDTALLGTDRSASEGGYLFTRKGYPEECAFLNWERSALKYKNLERWLYQYDASPDGITKAVKPLEISASRWFEKHGRYPRKLYNQSHAGASENKEYGARRTDQHSGNNAIYFRIETKWYRFYHGPVTILVTFRNVNESTWQVEYDGVGGVRRTLSLSSTAVEGKTAAFHVNSLQAAGRCAGNNDFRLLRIRGDDLTVQFVRIVKVEEHSHSKN
jgi:hypothetical protein